VFYLISLLLLSIAYEAHQSLNRLAALSTDDIPTSTPKNTAHKSIKAS